MILKRFPEILMKHTFLLQKAVKPLCYTRFLKHLYKTF